MNEMNFAMTHAPGARSIIRPVGQESSVLPLYHGCLSDDDDDDDNDDDDKNDYEESH